jgi:hypothetical protein
MALESLLLAYLLVLVMMGTYLVLLGLIMYILWELR